jgi:hypothetical protein
MKRLALYIVAASFLATPLLVQAGEAPTPLKAVAQIKGLTPLSDQALAQIRGQGWADVLAAALASCGGSCNVQHVSQISNNPNSSNASVINQSN